MCLTTLAKYKIGKFGWKVVQVIADKLWPPFYGECGKYLPNAWNVDSRNRMLDTTLGELYRTGYHICLTKAETERFVGTWYKRSGAILRVMRVQFKDVTAKGFQKRVRVVVARRFRFVKSKPSARRKIKHEHE